MKWQSATLAPIDGRTLLFASGEELMFVSFRFNKWTKTHCFTSTDPEGNFSINNNNLAHWVYLDGVPDPKA